MKMLSQLKFYKITLTVWWWDVIKNKCLHGISPYSCWNLVQNLTRPYRTKTTLDRINITVEQISAKIGISYGRVESIIKNELKFQKISAQCNPCIWNAVLYVQNETTPVKAKMRLSAAKVLASVFGGLQRSYLNRFSSWSKNDWCGILL